MTKKILTLLAMMSIAAMMMLSSCTAAGVECGLIGVWEMEDNSKVTWEITADDKIIAKTDGKKTAEAEIEEVKDKEIHLKGGPTIEYSDLGCDTVTFNSIKFKKVY